MALPERFEAQRRCLKGSFAPHLCFAVGGSTEPTWVWPGMTVMASVRRLDPNAPDAGNRVVRRA
jgi:hypothetical protein